MSYTAEQTLAMVEAALSGFAPQAVPSDEALPDIVELAVRFREAAEKLESIQNNVLYVSARTCDPRISGGGFIEGTFVAPAPYANVVMLDVPWINDAPFGLSIGTECDFDADDIADDEGYDGSLEDELAAAQSDFDDAIANAKTAQAKNPGRWVIPPPLDEKWGGT